MTRHPEIDLKGVRTVSVEKRPTKVRIEQFAPAPDPSAAIGSFDQFLPDILTGAALRQLIEAWVVARADGRPAIAMLGGHVIKTGVQRPLIALLEAGAFTAVAMNGAAAIHDFEIAMWGTPRSPSRKPWARGSSVWSRKHPCSSIRRCARG